jgi:hypothetical protein
MLDQDGQRQDRGKPRVRLHAARPALPAVALLAAVLAPLLTPGAEAAAGQRDPLLAADEAEAAAAVVLAQDAVEEQARAADHRRDHGHRRERDGRDRDRAADRDAVQERQAQQQHAEQRDDDGDRREHHGPARGVERLLDRAVAIHAGPDLAAEARHDEQRVVDADAEADQLRELAGEVRRVDEVADERDQADRRAQRQQRREQRQAGRDRRAEGDQQDERREQDADERAARAALVGEARRLGAGPAVLDLQARRAGGEQVPLDVLERVQVIDVVGRALVGDRRDAEPAVPGDLAALERRAHAGQDVPVLVERPLGRGLDRGPVVLQRPGPGLEDDLVGVALDRGEVLAEQVVGALGLGARQADVLDFLLADGAGEDRDDDQRAEPREERAPAVVVARSREAHEA